MKTLLIIALLLLPNVVRAQSDAEIVAATLIMEAGGEYAKGSMEAVNEVMHTRAERRGTTPAIEALRRKQFSCWNGVTKSEGVLKAKKHRRWELALRIANGPVTNFARGADHYHATSVNPYWAKSMKKTVAIGNHIFYDSRR
jgi:spore germination cell wall hydrolase CwlJ-like protein